MSLSAASTFIFFVSAFLPLFVAISRRNLGSSHRQVKWGGRLALLPVVLFLFALSGCGGSPDDNTTPAFISFGGPAAMPGASVSIGGTAQLKVVVTFRDGSTNDITSQARYTTSNANVATVDSAGKLTAVGPGTVTITSTYQSLTAGINITVAA